MLPNFAKIMQNCNQCSCGHSPACCGITMEIACKCINPLHACKIFPNLKQKQQNRRNIFFANDMFIWLWDVTRLYCFLTKFNKMCQKIINILQNRAKLQAILLRTQRCLLHSYNENDIQTCAFPEWLQNNPDLLQK